MIFFSIKTEGDRNFGYIAGCEKTKKALVVDPSPNPQPVYDKVSDLQLNIKYIVNTHDHYDHNGGNAFFKEKTNATVVQHKNGKNKEISVQDGDILQVGTLKVQIIHTPGHTPCSICLLVKDKLITGDTLFVGKVGGTRTKEDAREEFESLKKLMTLPKNTFVYPGHDVGVKPFSTIEEEQNTNPFIKRLNSFEDFFYLKNNWAAYKLKHNIK
jgi:glyoxylase-like metal-dependent hydrolase (beta-lactamase superfamily II)